jgi:hypothetical protein|eukprot:COSAG06_NODE_9882_length_1797_cov_1.480565_1_plen_146_part_00
MNGSSAPDTYPVIVSIEHHRKVARISSFQRYLPASVRLALRCLAVGTRRGQTSSCQTVHRLVVSIRLNSTGSPRTQLSCSAGSIGPPPPSEALAAAEQQHFYGFVLYLSRACLGIKGGERPFSDLCQVLPPHRLLRRAGQRHRQR